jgi:hypothetical protein
MDHIDRLLEIELARMLDPIVKAPVPRRRRRHQAGALLAVTGGLSFVPSEMTVLVEPVPSGR